MIRGLWRALLVLVAVNLLALSLVLYGVNQAGPIVSASVGDDECSSLDGGRPDPLDPDCVYGGLGGVPMVTAEEAAAARNLWPDPRYVLIGLSGGVLLLLVILGPDALRLFGSRRRERSGPVTG